MKKISFNLSSTLVGGDCAGSTGAAAGGIALFAMWGGPVTLAGAVVLLGVQYIDCVRNYKG